MDAALVTHLSVCGVSDLSFFTNIEHTLPCVQVSLHSSRTEGVPNFVPAS